MLLNWVKCQGDVWCNFENVNLEHSHFDNRIGVYIIWHVGESPKTVYVGQGLIKDRLKDHRTNEKIQEYSNLGLYVTWATVSRENLDGVEKYLASQLSPCVGKIYPNADPIQVNLPWRE